MADPSRLEQLFEQFSQQFTQSFTLQFETLTAMMQEQREFLRHGRREGQPAEHGAPVHRGEDFYRKAKVDFPRFESGDPTEWIYKVNKYFEFNKISEDSKLPLVALHLDGAASSWYQWLETNHQVRSWVEFTFQIQIRWDPHRMRTQTHN